MLPRWHSKLKLQKAHLFILTHITKCVNLTKLNTYKLNFHHVSPKQTLTGAIWPKIGWYAGKRTLFLLYTRKLLKGNLDMLTTGHQMQITISPCTKRLRKNNCELDDCGKNYVLCMPVLSPFPFLFTWLAGFAPWCGNI